MPLRFLLLALLLLGLAKGAIAQVPGVQIARAHYEALRDRTTRDGVGICVALSGGGMRAAAFHAGVLLALDSRMPALGAQLDGIDILSAVSGGSITAALYARVGQGRWHTEGVRRLEDFIDSGPVRATARTFLRGVFSGHLRRSESFRDVLDSTLFNGARFSELTDTPHLILVTTNFGNGEPVILSKITTRDHSDFRLATGVAASSAIPIIFDPILVRNLWVHAEVPDSRPQIRGGSVALYDGGIHDNLALDPILERAQEAR